MTVFRLPKQPYYRIRDQQLGWGMRTKGGVDLDEIAAPVHGVVLREPYVEQLAHKLEERLRKAAEATWQPNNDLARPSKNLTK